MKLGAHLPLIDFDGSPVGPSMMRRYVDAAGDNGFSAITANDHLVFQRPWLDGIVTLASVLERSGDLTLATTVALPVIRGPAALAKAASALQILSGDRFVLGVGPGSSVADYDLVTVPFEERWPRFDKAVRVLRSALSELEPVPSRPVPVWIGSWGSAAGLRRVARLGDGWLASAYNTTPEQLAAGRDSLHAALRAVDREDASFPIGLATMWTYLTNRKAEAQSKLDALGAMLKRDPATLADQVLIGDAEACLAKLASYADAGVGTAFLWPVGDPVTQLEHLGAEVVPHLAHTS